ncbi:hypothetical protein D3C83_300010 [compost metagenome]
MGADDKDDVVRMFLAKNRMGREVEQVLVFNGAKGEIRDMTFDEMAEYATTREKEEKEYLKAKFNKV